jgi:1-acyl-sn-glycerol-3-phosphate acyltransferase
MFNLADLNLKEKALARLLTPEIEEIVARIPKPVGSFGYDAWGYNQDKIKLAVAVCKRLYDHYFRVQTYGLHNIPAQGRVLIVPNHSGQLPVDGMLIGVALATNPTGPRAPRAMVERFFPTLPWLGNLLSGIGAVIGDPLNCSKLLEQEEAVIVFPEGVRGSGKPYRERYRLKRFGTGFMHLAMNHNTPIVPVGVIGCEETMPALLNIKPLARMLGLPYFPLGPLLPLPARVSLHFGTPMHFPPGPATEVQVGERVERVKIEIRKLIDQGLGQRTSIYR